MPELHFDARDILMAPRLAWSYRKMLVAIRGICAAWLVYILFSYISILLTENGRAVGFINLVRYFEFFPALITGFNGSWQYLVYAAGIVLGSFLLLGSATAVARIAFEDVRGNDVFQAKEAMQFAKTHRATVFVSVAVLCGLFLVFPASLLLWGIVGRIPVVGELVFALSGIPVFLWALLGIVVFIVFLSGLCLIPAITACMCEDVLETVIQTFSTVLKKPCRFLLYELTAKIVSTAAPLILAVFSLFAVVFAEIMCGQFFGSTFKTLFTISLYRVPGAVDLSVCIQALFARVNCIISMPAIIDISGVSITTVIAGWLLGLSYLFLIAWIVSYSFSTFFSSQTLIYLAIRKQKDGDDLRLIKSVTDFVPEAPDEN